MSRSNKVQKPHARRCDRVTWYTPRDTLGCIISVDSPVLPILPGRVLLLGLSARSSLRHALSARFGHVRSLRSISTSVSQLTHANALAELLRAAKRRAEMLYPMKNRVMLVSRKSPTTIRVNLVRFFSMMVVPEKVPPIPPPSEEESPPPFPEWRRIRPTKAMQNMT